MKKFLRSRLIMNSRQLWNSHQRHKFLRAETSRNILSLGNRVSRGVQQVFSIPDAIFFRCNTRKTGNNAVKMSQVFHDMAQFKCFTDLNLCSMSFKTGKRSLYNVI